MKFINYPLSENLETKVQDLIAPNCLFVFPTLSSAKRAARDYLQNWDLSNCLFYSMEELRAALILPEQPVLTDEKRLLCLYLVMEESEREFFHIFNYSDIVDWGRRFFDFYEELCEECVAIEALEQLPDSGTFHTQEWQEIYLQKIITIRNNYCKFIGSMGFSDAILYLLPENITVPWQGYNIYFINQYYYSALEKRQIKALEDSGNNISIVTHSLEISGNAENWKVQDFDLQSAWNSLKRKPQIEILESDNETQMALAFLAWFSEQKRTNGAIIDSSFYLKSYSHFFPEEHFAKPDSYSFSEGTIYKMLVAVRAGLKSINESEGSLAVKILANYISDDWFCRYFYAEELCLDPEVYLQQLRMELAYLIDRDYLYVDCALFDSIDKPMLKNLIREYYRLIYAFGNIKNLTDLCALIDAEKGLSLNKLLNEEEKQYTDIMPVFWKQMANFTAIENLGLISSWQQIWAEETLGENLLELLVNYLKSAKITLHRKENLSPEWEISNLLDSRNRNYRSIAFLQMIEGSVPSSPTPVWLFNESQRAKLGLKTYNDIRSRERYYFFRLLLCSEQAVCLSYVNQEKDISPSSFLGELAEFLKDQEAELLSKKKVVVSLQEVYKSSAVEKQIVGVEDNEQCQREKNFPEDFFIIPSDPAMDIPQDKNVLFSASSLIQFLKNPFLWFVENKCKLSLQNWEAEETISYKLFGNIMHTYFSTTLAKLKGEHTSVEQLEQLFGNNEKLERQLKEVINSAKHKYQIPKNYNADFLGDILAKRLAQSLNIFYTDWLKKQIDRREFILLPEMEELYEEEYVYKPLGVVQFADNDYTLSIKGRADLRIELENKAFIVDFKTGSHDYRQLCIYEWYYYLLDEVLPEDSVSSLFWNIFDPSGKMEGVKEDKRQKLKTQIFEHFLSCLANGYSTITKIADRQRLQNITRADLLNIKKGGV
ncbi:MAG: PD-(D/E)XK nuclease family protein [Candidatus Cloacimonas sp.]